MLLIRPRDPLSFRLRFYLLLALAVLLSEMGPAEAQSYRNDEKDDDDDDGTGEKFSQKYEEEVWRAEGSEEQKQEEMKNEKSWEEKYKDYQAEFMNLEMSPDFNFLQSRLPISGKGSKGERNHRIDDAINNNVIRNDEENEKNSPGTFGEQISDIFDGETLAGRVETEREEEEEEGHRIRKRTNSRKEELSELAKEEGRNEEEQIVKDEKKEQEESSDEEEEEEQEEETIVKNATRPQSEQSLSSSGGKKATNSNEAPDQDVIFTLRFALEGILVAVICKIGICGNLLSMFILLRKKLDLQPFLCRLLILLIVFDTVFLITDFMTYSLPMLNDYYHDYIYPKLSPLFLLPLSQVALTGSVYSIVAITVERYVSCCWPHIPPRDNNFTNTCLILGIVSFSFLYNITRFFEYVTIRRFTPECISYLKSLPYEVLRNVSKTLECTQEENMALEITWAELRNDPNYIRYFMLCSNSIVMVLLPLFLLIFLNAQIHKALKKREEFKASLTRAIPSSREDEDKKKERDFTVTKILVAIVVMFCICQSFKIMVVSYEVIAHFYYGATNQQPYPLWVEIVINLNHVALALNAAINIAIYICKDQKFRTACSDVFRCPRFRSLSLCLGGQRLRGQQHSDSNGVVTGSDSNGGCGGGTTGGSSSLTVARSSQGGVSGSSPDTATTARSSLLFEPDRDRGCHQAAKVIPRRDVIVDINGQSRSAVSASSSSVASAKGLILASSQEELQTLMINSEIQDSQC